MKIKVLLIPCIIIAIVAVFVGLVYPTYSNGEDGVSENYAKLKSEQTKLSELQNKNKNIVKLSSQLSSLPEKNTLYSFIPEIIKEEDIVNSLINLASSSGVFLFETKINQPVKEKSIQKDLEATFGEEQETSKTSSIPKTSNFKADIKVMGSYEKIKAFLTSIEKLNRNNNFEILKINRNKSQKEVSLDEATINSNDLVVDASVEFNFLKKSTINKSDVGNLVFSSSELETKVIEDIKNQKNTNSFQLNVDQKGKGNLFQP